MNTAVMEAVRALVEAARAKKTPKELNRRLADLDEAVKAADEAFDEQLVKAARDAWESADVQIDERPIVSLAETNDDVVGGWVQAWVFAHYREDKK